MGKKITIDSATMMNKGLEVIEAYWLFGVTSSQIDIIVHPESIIHSMVEFVDGSVKAQLGVPDMKIPIQYAITYPHHYPAQWESLDLEKMGALHFEKPDLDKFPCIRLVFQSMPWEFQSLHVPATCASKSLAKFETRDSEFQKLSV